MNRQPPRLARKLFKLIAGSAHIEDLLGDLDEWFYFNLERQSPLRAKTTYWKQVISLSFSYALRKRKRDVRVGAYASSLSFSPDMLRNYIKIAVRNLYQYKYFSILNAFGLAIGMSVSLLLIALYSYVSTYDNFHVQKDYIYSVMSTRHDGVEEAAYATAPAVLAEKIRDEFPGAGEVIRIRRGFDVVKTLKEDLPVKSYYVEPAFLSVFTFELLQGNASSLDKRYHAILTRAAAQKFFNDDDVVGKTLEMKDGQSLIVAGILDDIPKNTHFDFEMLVSYASVPESRRSVQDQWQDFPNEYVYVQLRQGTYPEQLQSYMDNVSRNTYAQLPVKVEFGLIPLEDLTMGPDLRSSLGVKWEGFVFIIFGIFALLILLPACFNYTNISIARAMKRAKEIGLRKTMGGVNRQIFLQFITETIVITCISLVGGVLIFFLIRAEFQSMIVGASKLDLSLTWRMAGMFILFALATGIAAGIFPAFHFARLNPIQALKSKVNARGSSMRVRKVLTVFQFVLSFGFILALVAFNKQYRYSMNFDVGFEKQNIVDVELQDVDQQQFRTAFSRLAPVRSISMSSGLLGVGAPATWVRSGVHDSVEVFQLFVDANYIDNFGLKFLAGRNFPDEPMSGERHLIVNEEFLKAYNIKTPSDAIGSTYFVEGQELEVIGVLKNFHFAPLRYPIEKFFFRNKPSECVYANLVVTSADPFTMFTQMENTWKQFSTQRKFAAQYFEDELNDAYSSYKGLLKIVGFLGLLALTISLLGMLGMVVYTSETRTKEVGIRKVMGATATGIALMLSGDYLKMMGWALVISIPATVILLDRFLPGIQYYSVSVSVWDVLLSAVVLVGIGLVTITSQTYKTAMSNPATTLRSE